MMRKSIFLVVLCALSAPLSFTQGASGSKFVQDFEKHWANAKGLAVAVANAMPAEDYSFKPVPAEMSFGEQMMHITGANYSYCAFLGGTKSAYQKPKDATKEQIVKDLGDSFDYCTKTFDGINDAQLDKVLGTGDRAVDGREVMLGAMIHMAHHRGQAEVYLRLKGITPPEYKW
jgi:uncharacterized damage-inducible protein DinB